MTARPVRRLRLTSACQIQASSHSTSKRKRRADRSRTGLSAKIAAKPSAPARCVGFTINRKMRMRPCRSNPDRRWRLPVATEHARPAAAWPRARRLLPADPRNGKVRQPHALQLAPIISRSLSRAKRVRKNPKIVVTLHSQIGEVDGILPPYLVVGSHDQRCFDPDRPLPVRPDVAPPPWSSTNLLRGRFSVPDDGLIVTVVRESPSSSAPPRSWCDPRSEVPGGGRFTQVQRLLNPNFINLTHHKH